MNPGRSDGVLGDIFAADVDEEVMRAMSVRERRYVIYHLLDHERVTLDELADVLAGWMAVAEERVTTRIDRGKLRIALYHNHLPKLAGVDLVEFDPEARTVDRSPLSEDERKLVEAAYHAEHWTDGEADG